MVVCQIRRWLGWLMWIPGIALLWPLAVAFPINGGDALWVAQSSRALVTCARAGDWSGCPGTFQFGWLQHIPGIFLAWKGMDDNSIVTVLTLLNFVGIAWIVVRLFRRFSVGSPIAWAVGLLILLGPIYAFSVYSFSEGLLFVLLVALFLALWDERHLIEVFVVAFLISSSKETSLTIVLPIAVAVWCMGKSSRRQTIRQAVVVIAASISGLVAVLFFNYWKFGSIKNTHYTDPMRRVTNTQLIVKNFLAIWISPSGGVFPFWFVGGLVALGLPIVVMLKSGQPRRTRLSAIVLLGTLIVQTVILSLWYAPFGWVTWGPRLIMPIVGVIAVMSLVMFNQQVIDTLVSVRFKLILVSSTFAVATLSGVSNLGFILDRAAALAWFTPPLLPSCPVTANIEINQNYYFNCALDFAPWQLGRTVWDSGLHQVTQGWAIVYVVASLVLFVNLCVVVSRIAVRDNHYATGN